MEGLLFLAAVFSLKPKVSHIFTIKIVLYCLTRGLVGPTVDSKVNFLLIFRLFGLKMPCQYQKYDLALTPSHFYICPKSGASVLCKSCMFFLFLVYL